MDYISQYKVLYILVLASLLFFGFKGIRYAFIGSFVPLIFIILTSVLLYLSLTKSVKAHRRILKIWGALLLFWATVRIGLGVSLYFDTHLTESHLREHFNLLQNIISVAMLVISIGIFKQLKKSKRESS